MLIDYKQVGDTLTDAELNAYASFLANCKTLSESFKLKNGEIIGDYGKYTFDLSNASIVDNGILITDETLSNDITVKLSGATQHATYTLYFTVIRYSDTRIMDEDDDNIESFDLSIDLIEDTFVNIPLEDLQEYDVILFETTVTVKHDKPEIRGKYVTGVQVTSEKDTVENEDTLEVTVKATDLDKWGVAGKTINLYQVFTPTIQVSASKNTIIDDETSTIKITLKDNDGSRIKNQEVKLYQISEE